MNRMSIKQLLVLMFVFIIGTGICDAQTHGRRTPRNPEKSLFGSKSRKGKATKVREPKAVTKAKNKQAKNKEKLKKEYNNFVEESKKHNYQIQSPEVKARMQQDQKDITYREKARMKKTLNTTRKAGKKYK
jgi:cytochrome c556